jgi:catechol 2,3-dioxygenase
VPGVPRCGSETPGVSVVTGLAGGAGSSRDDAQAIDPRASVGHVHLTVSDMERMLRFYRDVLGFREARTDAGRTVYLSADGLYPFHLGLTRASAGTERPGGSERRSDAAVGAETADRTAVRAGRRSVGLYHAAFLMPDRRALGRVVRRLLAEHVALDGAADHLVSEAVYLHDPEGNGLELYADRPRDRWPRRGAQIVMANEPLDLDALIAEGADGGPWAGIHPDARLGHVHLRVSDLGRAEAFYHGVLGFDVTVRTYPGALFLSAGGYHHHLGVNVWGSLGADPAPPGDVGLRYVTVTLPDRDVLARIVRRAADQGARVEQAVDHGLYEAASLRDTDGIQIVLTVDRHRGRVPTAEWTSRPLTVGALLDG